MEEAQFVPKHSDMLGIPVDEQMDGGNEFCQMLIQAQVALLKIEGGVEDDVVSSLRAQLEDVLQSDGEGTPEFDWFCKVEGLRRHAQEVIYTVEPQGALLLVGFALQRIAEAAHLLAKGVFATAQGIVEA